LNLVDIKIASLSRTCFISHMA